MIFPLLKKMVPASLDQCRQGHDIPRYIVAVKYRKYRKYPI